MFPSIAFYTLSICAIFTMTFKIVSFHRNVVRPKLSRRDYTSLKEMELTKLIELLTDVISLSKSSVPK